MHENSWKERILHFLLGLALLAMLVFYIWLMFSEVQTI